MIKLLSIFFISTFMFASIVEARDFHFSSDKGEVSHNDSSEVEHSQCDDCDEKDCSDEGSCCQSFCKCTSAYISAIVNEVSCKRSLLFPKIKWHSYSNYISPLLDPALKPPLFS